MMQSKLPPSFKANKLSREDVKARLRLADQPKAAMETEDPAGAQFVLNVMEIRPYDKNPRQATYKEFANLKESIRSQGFQGAFPVTRRPGEKAYMLAQGYNQRLRAVQELWQETGEARFRDAPAIYVQWTCESANQARHLSENVTRSDMTFWDKATGFLSFKETREAEMGAALTLRKLEEEAKKVGIQVSITALSFFLFAATKLAALRAEIHDKLTLEDIKTIQPTVNRLAAIHKTFGIDEDSFTTGVLAEAIDTVNRESIHQEWSAKVFIAACEQALAKKVHVAADEVRVMVALNERFPSLDKDELLEAARKPTPKPLAKTDVQPRLSELQPTTEPPPRPEAFYGVNKTSLTNEVLASADAETTMPLSNKNGIQHLLDETWRLVERLAQATQVDDLIHRSDTMPAGFYMEVQSPDEPNLDFDTRELRHSGWWMLASVSGQLNRRLSARMPKESTWRRAHQNEDPDLTLEYVVQERLGMFCYLTTVAPWLIEPNNPIGDAYYALLGTLRVLREAAPERFEEGSPE
jgi:ParB family protein of integrating conjugative element (PFGI_1 class)